jgi:hypothetical protein
MAKDRRLRIQLNDKYHKLFIAQARIIRQSKSEHGAYIIMTHLKTLTDNQQKQLLRIYAKLTDEQRQHPNKD